MALEKDNRNETYYNWNYTLKKQFNRIDPAKFVIQRNNYQREKHHRKKKMQITRETMDHGTDDEQNEKM